MTQRVDIARVQEFSRLRAGTWIKAGDTVWVSCGACGSKAPLDHTVDDNGNVEPSLLCPVDCGWHVYGKLLDYPKKETPNGDTPR